MTNDRFMTPTLWLCRTLRMLKKIYKKSVTIVPKNVNQSEMMLKPFCKMQWFIGRLLMIIQKTNKTQPVRSFRWCIYVKIPSIYLLSVLFSLFRQFQVFNLYKKSTLITLLSLSLSPLLCASESKVSLSFEASISHVISILVLMISNNLIQPRLDINNEPVELC